jgi:hypothetical protein
MHFSSAAIALTLATLSSALPAYSVAAPPSSCTTACTPPPSSSTTLCTPSSTPTPPCSTPLPPPTPSPCPPSFNVIRPKAFSQYDVWTGAVRYNEQRGKIFKDGRTTDVTTLITFDFPAASAGKTCSFHFGLSSDPAAKVSGTGQFDVFISLAPATRSTTTWPSGNLRDQHIGRMRAQPNAAATWVAGFPTFGQAFPCPAGQTYGGELVGIGDVDHVEWLASTSGPYIQWQ